MPPMFPTVKSTLLNKRIDVYWKSHGGYYAGTVLSTSGGGIYRVRYDFGKDELIQLEGKGKVKWREEK